MKTARDAVTATIGRKLEDRCERRTISSIMPSLALRLPTIRCFSILVLLSLASVPAVAGEELFEGRRAIVLEGRQARLVIDILGGSIVDFRLAGHELNPLRWANEGPSDEPRAMSHFLCLDRWGLPSEAEAANGMPGHGEAALVSWEVLDQQPTSVRMFADLPMAGLRAERQLNLASNGAWFHVLETVTNRNKLGRIYNMVQHPTLGPPFLDETVVVDSNATKGFMQGGSMPNPEEPSVVWPTALEDGEPVNLRFLSDDHDPNVVSYVIDEEIGWVTAANPDKGLLIGYVWRTAEYPWLNFWRRVENGKPLARGLEFGTTGLHQPFPILVEKGRIFRRPLLDFLDASESKTRSYVGFLTEIPGRYRGVEEAKLSQGTLTLVERGGVSRLKVPMPVEFATESEP